MIVMALASVSSPTIMELTTLVIIIPYLYYYLQVQDILCNIITD